MVKLIALGNRLMTDDGVAVMIAETLSDRFENSSIEFISGETDALFCFDRIGEHDFILILDAQVTGQVPGSVSVYDLTEVLQNRTLPAYRHDVSLLGLLAFDGKPHTGRLIGIEAERVEVGFGLGETLSCQFDVLCDKVKEMIKSILQEVEKCTSQKAPEHVCSIKESETAFL